MIDPNLIPVKYVGHRPTYTDGTYGTRIVFTQGETLLVPAAKAKQMLRHPDVYVPGDLTEPAATAPIDASSQSKKSDEDDQEQGVRDAVAAMDKAALEQFAKTHFNVEIDKRKAVATLRAEVTGLIDQYGVQ